MAEQAPRLAPPEQVRELLAAISPQRRLPDRLAALSERLLGRPYLAFPLVGGRDQPEELVTRLDSFDCVTFAESALALAWSRRPEDYPRRLVEIRYLSGRIAWSARNHYMTSWIARNVRQGYVERVLPRRWVWGGDTSRVLDLLPGYPAHRWRPRWFPSSELPLLSRAAAAGDVVCFVSSKPNLDTFHVGLLIPTADRLFVRHASRSAGRVIHQDLGEFLEQNQVPGMLIVRPLPTPRSPS